MKIKWNGDLEKRVCDSLIIAASGHKIYAVDMAKQVVAYIDLEETMQSPVAIQGMDQLDLIRGEPQRLRVAVSQPNEENQAYVFSGDLQELEALPGVYREVVGRSRSALGMIDVGLSVQVRAEDGALQYNSQRENAAVKIPLEGKKFVENYQIK